MFRNTRSGARDSLPTPGNGRGGNGDEAYDAGRGSKPAISESFIATIVWALLSLALIGGGWAYCSFRKLESTTVKCDATGCKVTELTNGGTRLLTVPRARMIRGELVRVWNGALVDPSLMGLSAQRKLGHTYAIVYAGPDLQDVSTA